ncbi:multidrug effflux MFS transporter [Shewanella surugensis]|uniref:Bcr/CflA family efflux transporter n=1 Tax=Shewanella surugensis TaxID=212020 RepID=A0ABT0LFL4_9GAMM|nr:multidrug effflux MFS transporter [Shewanella surugensis]MCL1126354.1 multidrug effflux MFS transporter [Shewanella surugensis]
MSTHPPAIPSFARLIPLLGAMIAITPFAIDMSLPAMTTLATQFHTPMSDIQQSLSLYLIGYSAGMFVFGPLADKWGRRRFVIYGLLGFMLSSTALALTSNIELFLLLRFFQAFTGAAATVVIPGYVKEIYGKDTAKGMSYVMLIMMLAPLIAPSIGSLILVLGDWNLIFAFMAVYTLIIVIVAFYKLKLPSDDILTEHSQLSFVKNYKTVLTKPGIALNIMTSFVISFAYFSYLTASPLVFMTVFGLSPEKFTLIFTTNVGALMLATAINSQLVTRFRTDTLLRIATLLATIAGVALLTVNTLGMSYQYTAAALVPLMGCLGIMSVNADTIVLMKFQKEIGTASAVIGTLKFGFGALGGPILALFSTHTAVPFAILMLSAVMLAGLLQILNRSHLIPNESL